MSFDRFNLNTNPFRLTPAVSETEIIWAGFSEIKEKFEKRITKSIRIPNSSLVLNWGEYGSGKTHASRYFGKTSVLKELSQKAGGKIPFFVAFTLQKGKNPSFETFSAIIDKINIEKVREEFRAFNSELNSFISNISDSQHIQSVLKAFFSEQVDPILIKKYLYGNLSAKELRELNGYGILRKLTSDSDYSKLIAGLFSCLTHERRIYSCVILWIDEFEDIAILNNVNIEKTNNFIRELLDNTPNGLLFFLNLTQTAMVNAEDLGQYLSEAVKSRIKERIHFEIPNQDTFVKYLYDLLNYFRLSSFPDYAGSLFPFEDDVVRKILKELGSASLRRLNEAFSLLLELADIDNEPLPITFEYFEKNKADIIGWKENF